MPALTLKSELTDLEVRKLELEQSFEIAPAQIVRFPMIFAFELFSPQKVALLVVPQRRNLMFMLLLRSAGSNTKMARTTG